MSLEWRNVCERLESFLSGRFNDPYGPGDREIRSVSGRVGMYADDQMLLTPKQYRDLMAKLKDFDDNVEYNCKLFIFYLCFKTLRINPVKGYAAR